MVTAALALLLGLIGATLLEAGEAARLSGKVLDAESSEALIGFSVCL